LGARGRQPERDTAMKREKNGRRHGKEVDAPRAVQIANASAMETRRGKQYAAVRVRNLGRYPWRLRGPPRMGGLTVRILKQDEETVKAIGRATRQADAAMYAAHPLKARP
jgi:hypothetical protein